MLILNAVGLQIRPSGDITVAIGSTRELMPSEILYTDSTDYLLGGSLTLKNGRIDRSAPNGDAFLRLAVARISGRGERIAKRRKKFQFDEGYCQATQYNATQDNFIFTMVCFLLKLHLYV